MMDAPEIDPVFAACAMTKCQRGEMPWSPLAYIQVGCPMAQSTCRHQLSDLCEYQRPARRQQLSRVAFLTFTFPCLRYGQYIKRVSLVEIVFADGCDKNFLLLFFALGNFAVLR